MIRIAEHVYSRKKALAYGGCVGIAAGLFNAYLPLIDFGMGPALYGWLAIAIVAVIGLHEGTHGAVAVLYGHRPYFGIKPPFFYVTFTDKVPRSHFIIIALAPLVVLDILFIALFAANVLRTLAYFCVLVNTIGAMGDLWIFAKLIRYDRSTLIQDTKNGIEVWQK